MYEMRELYFSGMWGIKHPHGMQSLVILFVPHPAYLGPSFHDNPTQVLSQVSGMVETSHHHAGAVRCKPCQLATKVSRSEAPLFLAQPPFRLAAHRFKSCILIVGLISDEMGTRNTPSYPPIQPQLT